MVNPYKDDEHALYALITSLHFTAHDGMVNPYKDEILLYKDDEHALYALIKDE